jgi:potassium efflux system protein
VTPSVSASGPLPAALAAALLSLAAIAPAVGQEATTVTEALTAAKTPEAVPADQIPARASSARVTLDSIRSRLPESGTDATDVLQGMSSTIDMLHKQPDMSRLDRLPEFRIAELQSQVRFYRRQLEKLESRDVARATRLSADAAELSRLRGVWSATLTKAEQDRLSYPLVDEARGILNRIDETELLLAKPLDEALAGRERASRYENRLATLASTLQEAGDRAKTRRWSRDVEPIWSAGALKVSPKRDWASVQARIDDQVQFSRNYFTARRGAIEVLGLIAVLAFIAVVWLRRKGEWITAGGEQLMDVSRVLKRPFSSVLLSVLVAALMLSDLAPPIVQETLAVATMLVILRLMPGRLVAGNLFLLVGLAILFLLDRARAMMPFDSLAFRADQLLVAVGMAAGYAQVLMLRRRGLVPARSWLSLLARVAPVALLLLAAAAVSNLVGNISLADLLVHGTLTSTYVSAILFAAAFIVDDSISMIVRTRTGQRLRMVTLRGQEIAQTSQRLVRVAALLLWGYITLTVFQLWAPVAIRIRNFLAASWSFGELSFTLGGVATFIAGVLIAVYSSRMVRFLLNEEVLTRVSWPTGAKSTTATLAYYGVLFAGLLLALGAAGIQTSQFTIVFGALGVGIGFGLQNVVNNFVSGLILMFERPIQPDDIIDVDTLQGKVVEIGLRATRVRTWDGAEVVVPNGTLLSGNLINWTLSDNTRRVELPVGVAYGSDARRVLEILMGVCTAQADVMKDPAPVVLFKGLGESSLDFTVRFWARDAATAVSARSEVGVAIVEALEAEGIEIPFPQRDLHLRSVDPDAAQALNQKEVR